MFVVGGAVLQTAGTEAWLCVVTCSVADVVKSAAVGADLQSWAAGTGMLFAAAEQLLAGAEKTSVADAGKS